MSASARFRSCNFALEGSGKTTRIVKAQGPLREVYVGISKQEAVMSEGYVRQLDEDLVQIEADLQRYERLLVDAKSWSRHPSPNGFERMNNVSIIEGVIAELERLRARYLSECAKAHRP